MDDLVLKWVNAAIAQIDGEELDDIQNNSIVELFDICSDDPSRAFNVICQILATNPREDVLGYLGAGPLEDLLINNCDYIDKAIEEVENTKLLRGCLEHVNMEIEDCSNAKTLYDFLKKRRRLG
jgi:hypothetical protein